MRLFGNAEDRGSQRLAYQNVAVLSFSDSEGPVAKGRARPDDQMGDGWSQWQILATHGQDEFWYRAHRMASRGGLAIQGRV